MRSKGKYWKCETFALCLSPERSIIHTYVQRKKKWIEKVKLANT